MDDETVYFEGDPATESARRHMERVLKEADAPRPKRARWPWVLAIMAGGGSWAVWRMLTRQLELEKRDKHEPPNR